MARPGTATYTLNHDNECEEIGSDRRICFLWMTTIVLINQILSSALPVNSLSISIMIDDIFTNSVFQYLAWYAVLCLIQSSDRAVAARWQDLLVTIALCVFLFSPTTRSIWISATGAAIYLLIFGGDPKLRAAGTVLTALSVQEFWGHVLFNIVAKPLLHAETAIVGTLLATVRPGTMWHGNVITGPDGFGIIIYSGCSSFHNLSLALLCWITISRLRSHNWHFRDLRTAGIVGATIILLNIGRLLLMASNISLFRYWHDGAGAQIFAVGASSVILLISLYGSKSTGK